MQCFFQHWDTEACQVPYAELIRLFEKYGCFDCEILVTAYDISGRVDGSYTQPPMFSACNDILACQTVNEDQIQALIAQVPDINERQYNGETLLMEATNTKSSNMIRLMEKLLKANADVRAIEDGGRSILFHLCYRLSSCRDYVANGKEQEDVVILLQELISRGAPVQQTSGYCSPTEMALTPVAWVLWCQALERSGVDIEDLLREEDEANICRSPSSEDIQELMGDITGPKIVDSEHLLDERPQTTCNLCGGGVGPVYYRPPFNLYYRIINVQLAAHESFNRHEDGLACRNAIHENSCMRYGHNSDGDPLIFWESLSIRKWAALWLWRNGWLPTPEDAEDWATDVITEEALESFGHLSAIRV